jgi:hypothetical protein
MFVTSRQVHAGASLLMTVMGSTNAMIKWSNRLIRNKDMPWVSTQYHFKSINCFKNMLHHCERSSRVWLKAK